MLLTISFMRMEMGLQVYKDEYRRVKVEDPGIGFEIVTKRIRTCRGNMKWSFRFFKNHLYVVYVVTPRFSKLL
ncbi:hypothetical protein HanIR_Chr16g0819471 [Helianthus annuus]|nr:hypothetical protein HanIR_Chr16g0819471 [Helianthus annuus]